MWQTWSLQGEAVKIDTAQDNKRFETYFYSSVFIKLMTHVKPTIYTFLLSGMNFENWNAIKSWQHVEIILFSVIMIMNFYSNNR